MNYKGIGQILGKIMILEGIMLIIPCIVSFIYNESIINSVAFIVPMVLLWTLGIILQHFKPERKGLYQKEAFATVAFAWIIMTLFAAIPYIINREIPNYIDAVFEMMSGFTTTGASIVEDVTLLSHSSLFWRSFTHWIGGTGILVFILIFIPESKEGSSLYLLKAESPGPKVGKLSSKMKMTSTILYLIYLGLTILEIVFLLFSPDAIGPDGKVYEMNLFNSMLTAFGTAGTGGFGFVADSMEHFSNYSQYVISTFLILFGINFSLYFLILIGKIKAVLKNEELRVYFGVVFAAIALIMFDLILNKVNSFAELKNVNFEETFRISFFQVASIITTAGYTNANFDLWPEVSKMVLIILMLTGAMAGSTCGGIKMSRIVIFFKGIVMKIKRIINPRYVAKMQLEGEILEEDTVNDVFAFIAIYILVIVGVVFILCFDPACKNFSQPFLTNITASISCVSNIGPGLASVGPYASFAEYSYFSKIILTLTMLTGRLEIFPVLILFSKKTWQKM